MDYCDKNEKHVIMFLGVVSMNFLNVSNFFDNDQSPFVLGAFFSRYIFSEDKKYIYTYGWYKKSNVVETKISYEDSFDTYLQKINDESKPNSNWIFLDDVADDVLISPGLKRFKTHFYILKNDINLSEDSFFNKLYTKIVTQNWIYNPELNDNKKSFIRGFMELRGSIDTTANYLAQDYYYNSEFEIRKARVLIDLMGIPYNVINLNFRQLQSQFINGENRRNTQFRPNLWWYVSNVGIINPYKAEIFAKSRNASPKDIEGNAIYFYDNGPVTRRTNTFENRLSFYITNVFGRKLSEGEISSLRSDLGFDDSSSSSPRNMSLADLVRNITPDECAGCKNEYDIADRSYISNRTGRYYFEIHHVISIGSNHELDDENNMVKLCPTCHRLLKRGSGTRDEQIKLIKKIFENEPKTLEFAKHFFDTDDYDVIVQKTFESLN